MSRFARRLARIIGLLALAAGLSGCSAVKLGYGNLDRLAYWWLNRYLDFSGDQAADVQQDLARLHRWHRSEELPHVLSLLRDAEEKIHAAVTPDQVCAYVPRIRERLVAIADQALPAAAILAVQLAPAQLEHLQHRYDRNNAEFRRDWLRPDAQERQKKRELQFLERAEKLYGNLGETQRAALRDQLERSAFDPARTLADRQRRQHDALSILRQLARDKPPAIEAQRLLRDYIERTLASPDLAYRNYQQSIFAEDCRAFAALHNSTTAAQREAAARRLKAYQRDLRTLISP